MKFACLRIKLLLNPGTSNIKAFGDNSNDCPSRISGYCYEISFPLGLTCVGCRYLQIGPKGGGGGGQRITVLVLLKAKLSREGLLLGRPAPQSALGPVRRIRPSRRMRPSLKEVGWRGVNQAKRVDDPCAWAMTKPFVPIRHSRAEGPYRAKELAAEDCTGID